MYGRFLEHQFNSVSPKLSSKTAQSILKARASFARVPGKDRKSSAGSVLLQIPKPHHRIKPKAHSSGPLRTFALPCLGLLATEQLLCVLERILDAPSASKTTNDCGRTQIQICGEEEIVFLFAFRVSTDNQQYRPGGYVVPDNLPAIDQSLLDFASFESLYQFPTSHSLGHLLQSRQLFASFAGTTPSFLLLLAQQIVDICIPTHTRGHMCIGYIPSSQGRVKTVAMAVKPPFGQPLGNFCQHLLSQIDQCWAVFFVQSYIDGQSERLAAPRRAYSQSKNHQIQTPGMNYAGGSRTDGIAPPTGTVDLAAASVKECVVQIGWYYARRAKYPDQQDQQQLPQLAGWPGCIWEKAVIGIVGSLALRVGKGQDTCDRAFGRAKYPAGDQPRKNLCCRCRENCQKVLNNIRPCRYSNRCIHTNLPVPSFSMCSSEGWCVSAYSSLKLAA
jgi:hypothetical protein